jgi:prepilin-type processing-associated H-X9-DG protein
MFANDHEDMMPPAGCATGGSATNPGGQISWDSLINKYIGGNASADDLSVGVFFKGDAPQILQCPADQFPKANWLGGSSPWFALRSYSMVSVGPNWGANADYQRDPKNGLPNLNLPGKMSVGIYWYDPAGNTSVWDAQGYKASVVRDPAGTILLCENTSGQQCAGNTWTCCCIGPKSLTPNELYQTDNSKTQDPTVRDSVNQGLLLYQAQKNFFNYVFIDGHVESLKMEDTIGTGTLTVPKGMWTAASGD